MTSRSSESISRLLGCERLYSTAFTADEKVYRNWLISKFSPRSYQESHTRTSSANSKRHPKIGLHFDIASWTLQAFLFLSRLFSRPLQVFVKVGIQAPILKPQLAYLALRFCHVYRIPRARSDTRTKYRKISIDVRSMHTLRNEIMR